VPSSTQSHVPVRLIIGSKPYSLNPQPPAVPFSTLRLMRPGIVCWLMRPVVVKKTYYMTKETYYVMPLPGLRKRRRRPLVTFNPVYIVPAGAKPRLGRRRGPEKRGHGSRRRRWCREQRRCRQSEKSLDSKSPYIAKTPGHIYSRSQIYSGTDFCSL
jgi:hypothetical protein